MVCFYFDVLKALPVDQSRYHQRDECCRSIKRKDDRRSLVGNGHGERVDAQNRVQDWYALLQSIKLSHDQLVRRSMGQHVQGFREMVPKRHQVTSRP